MEMHNTYADGPANVTLTTTAETVVATIAGGISTPAGTLAVVEATVTGTTGASTTSVQVRVRRGTTNAGAQVGATYQVSVAAALLYAVSVQVADTPGDVAGASYVVTVQQVAATGNGTNAAASLQATWLS